MTASRIIVLLSTYCRDDGGLVSVVDAGGHHIERSRGSVIGDLARLLLAEGAPAAAELHVLDRDTGAPRLMPQPLGRWARTTVTESDTGGLRVARWRPGPSERVRQATVQRQLDAVGMEGD